MDEIYQSFLESTAEILKSSHDELKQMTPSHMDTMLENKQTREEAMAKRLKRKNMVVEDIPPTTPGNLNYNQEGFDYQMNT